MEGITMSTTTKSPAAKRVSAQREKADRNAKRVEELNARALPSRVELIAEAQALGVEGPISRMKVKDLAAAIELKKALAVKDHAEAPETTGEAKGLYGTERGRAASALRRQGPRGPGRRISDEELAVYVAKVKHEHPETSMGIELEYAYWVERMALSRTRWNKAWRAA